MAVLDVAHPSAGRYTCPPTSGFPSNMTLRRFEAEQDIGGTVTNNHSHTVDMGDSQLRLLTNARRLAATPTAEHNVTKSLARNWLDGALSQRANASFEGR